MKRSAAVFAALVAGFALTGTPSPAFAAEPLPDLSVSFQQGPVAEVHNIGKTIEMYVHNHGAAVATAVRLTLDLSEVGDGVVFSAPEPCTLDGTTVTCTVGRLDAGGVAALRPVTLASREGATPGHAGRVTVAVDGAEDDATPADSTASFPVTVLASGPDLIADASDLRPEWSPVGPGDVAPLYAAVINEGDRTAPGFAVTIELPIGAAVVERYRDCTYTDNWPDDVGRGFVYGPDTVTCAAPLAVEPGEYVELFNRTGTVFSITFGRNLSGPDHHHGTFRVAVADDIGAAGAGTGPSFADAVRRLRASASVLSEPDPDLSDNAAEFEFWSRPNKLDVAVTAPAVRGVPGGTVDLTYEVVNKGPSDGGGPSVLITAPTGTELLPAGEPCRAEGRRRLRCTFEGRFPSVASGKGKLRATVRLKITSTPGTNGTIVATSHGVGSTESSPADNTARIVVTSDADGGSGGGLPITGAPAGVIAGIGAALLILGVAALAATRRRTQPQRPPN